MTLKKIYNSQQGITIVIAIVLLAVFSFASFTLSAVVLRGVRSSRLIQRSEPALAGANAGSEVSLYRIQRSIGGLSVQNVSLGVGGVSYDVVPDLTDDPYPFQVTGGSQTAVINLYSADSPTDKDVLFRSVVITNTGPRRIDATVIPWSQADIITCNFNNMNAGQTRTCDLTNPDGDWRAQVIIDRQGGGGGSTADGTVRAFSGGGGTGQSVGIPSASPLVDVVGKGGGVQRKIQIRLSP